MLVTPQQQQHTIKTILNRYSVDVSATIRGVLNKAAPFLHGVVSYHLGWVDQTFQPTTVGRGKLLRPTLNLLVFEALSGDYKAALPVAAYLEMLHNFSLLHDDIEDNDRERRGRPTAWTIWGQSRTINVGDYLFAASFQALHTLDMTQFEPTTVLDVFQLMSTAAALLTEGQELDMSFESRLDVSPEMYIGMISKKTGALIEAAVVGGAMLATSDETIVQNYQQFAHNLGLAFQIQDDILGIWGDAEITGKSADNDLRRKKKTLPILYTLSQLDTDNAERLRDCYTKPEPLNETQIMFVRDCLVQTEAQAYTQSVADEYHQKAFTALEAVNLENEPQRALKKLARFLVDRTY
ncbi:polyprenyl synthetase family protein [Anaerolineales bacterium HSG6]|nr:polyprenyl synthetase family protein [Anaerolineales bacterium HSG6]MDM8532472.1 polyprenyl synthetase family protein [Anaerolineales bacterium HSG25]